MTTRRPPADEGPATLRDVALLAGVSPSTVSRILNGTARVDEAKRVAVQSAIQRLQFKPNLSARSLRSGSTMTIGVLTQNMDSAYFTRGMQALDEALTGSGYAPIVVPGHWHPKEEAERMALLIARKVDAIAIFGGHLPDTEIERFARHQPVAVTDRRLTAPNVDSFAFDQCEGGRLATRHLIELGHRRIALIGGPRSHTDAVQRQEGYMRAHAEAGIGADPRLVVEGDFTPAGGLLAMTRLLEARLDFSAAFCTNDQMLWGARLALQRRRLRVPDDVSLVGFDDQPESAYMTPPVTTVHQPIWEMGRAVAMALLHRLGRLAEPPPPLPPLALVLRETTRPR